MPVEISVSDVRTALSRAGGSETPGSGEAATLLLGKLFHEVFADLVGRDARRSGIRVLLEAGPDAALAERRLLDHAYTELIAPRLLRHHAHLQATTDAVLMFWRAQRALARWLTELAMSAVEREPMLRADWQVLEAMLEPEVALSCELSEAGWTDSVRIVGVADSLLRVPGRPDWCALELKLGRALPAVDLGQAALYHLILSRTEPSARGSALALLRFSPELEERVIGSDQVADAQTKLLDLIGRLAGVLPERDGPDPSRPAAGAPVTRGNGDTRASAQAADYADLGKRLVRAYRDYGSSLELVGAPKIGPRFLRFEARLGQGSRFDALQRRSGEVQLRLHLSHEPIVSREGGRLTLDVVRPDPEIVPFADVLDQLPRRDATLGSALLPVGVDSAGQLHCADLATPTNAHILAAGTTGSGKTEWLRMAIAGLLHSNTPDTLRLVLLDPKLAAFTQLEESPYMLNGESFWVPGAERSASEVFQDLVDEMESRYRLMREVGGDNLVELVQNAKRPIPRIVCVCDEYFALISQSREERKQIEDSVFLLGAKARAAGIHLILATQQPSRKVIQGALDSNMPCRVGLLTAKAEESRMLLGIAGAERLTGSGDLLYKDLGAPQRLQAPYLDASARARAFGRSAVSARK